jgi:EmrB/QacA subfamily drug resistance transporter
MLGSLLAGLSWSIEALIGFRIVQGLAGGMIMPLGQTILAQAVGPDRVGRVMSILGVPMLLAPISGPVVGGAVIQQASWRWLFFLNLPIGVAAVLLAWRLLPETPTRPGDRPDLRGLVLLPPGIALFVYGLSEVGARARLDAGGMAVAAAGLALVAGYGWHARGRTDALVDLSLFRRRGFATAAVTTLVVGIALFGTLILLPLYFQFARGEGPLATGLLLAPQGLGAAVAMPIAGWLTDRIGARWVVPAGIGLGLLGTAGYTQVGADTSSGYLAAALFVIGLGLGSTVMPAMALAYQSVPREAMPAASSALNTLQRIAGSFGTALLAVVLQRAVEAELPGLPGGIGAVGTLRSRDLLDVLPALARAFDTAFWFAFGLGLVALVPALLLRANRTEGAAR